MQAPSRKHRTSEHPDPASSRIIAMPPFGTTICASLRYGTNCVWQQRCIWSRRVGQRRPYIRAELHANWRCTISYHSCERIRFLGHCSKRRAIESLRRFEVRKRRLDCSSFFFFSTLKNTMSPISHLISEMCFVSMAYKSTTSCKKLFENVYPRCASPMRGRNLSQLLCYHSTILYYVCLKLLSVLKHPKQFLLGTIL